MSSYAILQFEQWISRLDCLADIEHQHDWTESDQVSISSTFYVQIFCTNVVLAAFSSYVLALAKNLYKKRARIMLMKLTKGHTFTTKLTSQHKS
jgi:hypothetical protein